jgi:hypothetical protein
MSNWAEIDENNVVIRVLTCGNAPTVPDEGESWLNDTFGGRWIKTSYNTIAGEHLRGGTPLRKNYAGIGYSYVEHLDAFIPLKPYTSWILNESKGIWEPPIPTPDDYMSVNYYWDEESISWKTLSV